MKAAIAPHKDSINTIDEKTGQLPIIMTARSGYSVGVQALVESGADVRAEQDGRNAFTVAIQFQRAEVNAYLYSQWQGFELSDQLRQLGMMAKKVTTDNCTLLMPYMYDLAGSDLDGIDKVTDQLMRQVADSVCDMHERLVNYVAQQTIGVMTVQISKFIGNLYLSLTKYPSKFERARRGIEDMSDAYQHSIDLGVVNSKILDSCRIFVREVRGTKGVFATIQSWVK